MNLAWGEGEFTLGYTRNQEGLINKLAKEKVNELQSLLYGKDVLSDRQRESARRELRVALSESVESADENEVKRMEITIEATPEEAKELLQAIESSQEQKVTVSIDKEQVGKFIFRKLDRSQYDIGREDNDSLLIVNPKTNNRLFN
ncbi:MULTISPECIES: hypothetical protein [Enterococcus]|uniref:hypothetical protein n=1 Tax=Enterococcus TaxID=1350 RepID=UPI001161EFF0|nr:hypothetical protein [Enterococcus avium]HBI1565123.1 hypothetical protein [Enterococcus faecalis]AYQ24190.1 hypothetical protein AUF16_06125 [Enterococcus avium]HBI1717435.1 hypothetical protein [Enterococcus faecalis]HBI1722800.1 hypothetical protein [Enterococcus faecalis]HBI1725911.1 hypothetical protein [Enterococcus faecalis]